jgi:hypothetical protein
MKTAAITAVLAAAVAASPAAVEKRASITPVTIKGNGGFRQEYLSTGLLTDNMQLSSLATSVSTSVVSTTSQVSLSTSLSHGVD